MFVTTCNKIFYRFANCAAGVLCPQRICRAIKNCLLLLMVALLAMPTLPIFAVEPRAAEPTPPDGYTKQEISITKTIDSTVLTVVSSGVQSITYPFSFSITELQNLDINNIWNKALYLESVTVPNNYYIRYNTTPGGGFVDWYLQANHVALGVKFTLEPYPWDGTNAINGNGNTPYLYIPFYWQNRAIRCTTNVTYTENPAFASQKLQARVSFTFHFVYYLYTGTDADKTIAAIGDAAQQITNAVTNNTNVVRNGFTQVQTGISTVNSNLNNINTSIKNGFQDTINNIQSLESSVNAGFVDIENGIKQQTDAVNSQIQQSAGAIVNNATRNTQKILDQNSQFRQEDKDTANSIGKIAQDFLDTNTEKVKSNFNILWEPIAFTQRVLAVFTGGTRSAAYADYLNGVTGFTYNPETGCLDPIVDISPKARYGRASSGTTITFPSYTLPVLNIKLWEEYSFDLATVKEAFPVLFNAIYVVTGCLCLYWFLGYLSDKFEEVYKE